MHKKILHKFYLSFYFSYKYYPMFNYTLIIKKPKRWLINVQMTFQDGSESPTDSLEGIFPSLIKFVAFFLLLVHINDLDISL